MVFRENYDKDIKMICTDGLKYCCYQILAIIIVNYKKKILITGIKINMQCFVYHVFTQN